MMWVAELGMQPDLRPDLGPGGSLHKCYPAVAESVPRAREALGSFAQSAGATTEQLDAIRLAVSEAATNVVVHAYDERPGEIRVNARLDSSELLVEVADDGLGMRPTIDGPGLGVGLALISQVADAFAVVTRSSGGTEVHMRFALGISDMRGHRDAMACAPQPA
jgi:serine/threonine-protein kinase RsbW